MGGIAYEVVEPFFKRPRGWSFTDVTDVAVDGVDNVWVFSRTPHPVMIFDKTGAFLDSWGELGGRYFVVPHGLAIARDGTVLTTDTGDHTVRRWTADGKLLQTLGRRFQPGSEYSGVPFNGPTRVAEASNGDLYVSDGYGNAHVHCFDAHGVLKFSWGGHGDGPGRFDVPHGVLVDRDHDDRVYVADRYNDRVQIFSRTGEWLGQWDDFALPNSVTKLPDGTFCVTELYHRTSIVDAEGRLLARFGHESAQLDETEVGAFGLPTSPARRSMRRGIVRREPGPGRMCAPHGAAVDSVGSLYVAEVAESWAGVDRGDRSIQKFVRVTEPTTSQREGNRA